MVLLRSHEYRAGGTALILHWNLATPPTGTLTGWGSTSNLRSIPENRQDTTVNKNRQYIHLSIPFVLCSWQVIVQAGQSWHFEICNAFFLFFTILYDKYGWVEILRMFMPYYIWVYCFQYNKPLDCSRLGVKHVFYWGSSRHMLAQSYTQYH